MPNTNTTANKAYIPKLWTQVNNELLNPNKNKEPSNNAVQPINKILLLLIISAMCPEKKEVAIKGKASVKPIIPNIISSFEYS